MNPLEMMKNLQQMQSKMQEAQAKIQRIRVEGRAGGDMVRVLMDGTFRVLGVTLAPECVDNRDVPMLQDLIVVAMEDAHGKTRAAIAAEMGSVTNGMPFLNQMMGQ
jgi:DNA-binding YbaB/EbfC family protein